MQSGEINHHVIPMPASFPTSPGPVLTRRSTFKPKPKSRFGEPSIPLDSDPPTTPRYFSDAIGSPITCSARVASLSSRAKDGGPDEREVYRRVTAQLSARKNFRMTVKFSLQFVIFLAILGCLICSFTDERVHTVGFFGLKLWKWFVFLMVIFSGMLITQWVVHLVVFFIEWKFILRKNVVYFTHGLKSSVGIFIWIGIVLGTWLALFTPDVELGKNSKSRKFLHIVTWTIASLWIASFLWLIKNTLLKLLASSFHLSRFFDRIQELVFDHYVLQTLSGTPMMESFMPLAKSASLRADDGEARVSFTEHGKEKKERKVIDVGKLHQMKKDKVPSYTMQLLVDVVSNSGLSTVSGMLEENHVEGGVELDDDEITSEEQAITTAVRILKNVDHYKDDHEYIDTKDLYMDRNDLRKFMMEEEVKFLFPMFEPDVKGHITLKAMKKWVVKVFKDRQQLQHALNDNKTAFRQLNNIVTIIVVLISFVLWLLLTEMAPSKLLLFIASQLVVAAFIFGNTCRTMFEAIVFVFVMHPFDVGDLCVIDGGMMIVEEMNILTTVLLKPDKEKVYYPNSVLATKPISNFYRSPENQGDSIEFKIDFMTPLAKIGELKERIKKYIEANAHFWQPDHTVVVKEIENVNMIKMGLFFNHTINFQDYGEKNKRRSEAVLELKKIFEDLQIKCNLPSQEVVLANNATIL